MNTSQNKVARVSKAWRLCLIATAAVAALGVASCGKKAEPGAQQANGLIRIRVAGGEGINSATPLFVAIKQGFFKDAGLDVTYLSMSGGATAMAAALKAGEVDVGLGAATQWMTDTARGAIQGKLVGEFTDNNYVILAKPGITQPSQLKGKIFAISSHNGGDHLYSQAVLKHHGVSPDDVTWLPMGEASSRLSALMAGKVDGTELTLTNLPPSAAGMVIVSVENSPVQFVSNAIYANNNLLSVNKPAVSKFLAAIGRGADYARAHPDVAIAACQDSGSSLEACKSTIAVAIASKNPFTWSSTSGLNATAIAAMQPIVAEVVPQAKTLTLADFADLSVAAQLSAPAPAATAPAAAKAP